MLCCPQPCWLLPGFSDIPCEVGILSELRDVQPRGDGEEGMVPPASTAMGMTCAPFCSRCLCLPFKPPNFLCYHLFFCEFYLELTFQLRAFLARGVRSLQRESGRIVSCCAQLGDQQPPGTLQLCSSWLLWLWGMGTSNVMGELDGRDSSEKQKGLFERIN